MSAGTRVFESRNTEFPLVLSGLDGVVVLRNRYFAVSGETILLVDVGDVDCWTFFLISQEGGLGDARPRPLWDVIDSCA